MLILDLKRAITGKGIENPSLFLRQCGITSYTACRLLNNYNEGINFKHLELICYNLNCTIDDLFVWQPGKNTPDIKDHPLQKLKQKQSQVSIGQKIKQLPFDKIEELTNYIDQLKNK